jgi:hypothetical protein
MSDNGADELLHKCAEHGITHPPVRLRKSDVAFRVQVGASPDPAPAQPRGLSRSSLALFSILAARHPPPAARLILCHSPLQPPPNIALTSLVTIPLAAPVPCRCVAQLAVCLLEAGFVVQGPPPKGSGTWFGSKDPLLHAEDVRDQNLDLFSGRGSGDHIFSRRGASGGTPQWWGADDGRETAL